MSFEEKLEKQFDNFSLGSPKVAKYIEHIYADYIELNALFLKEEVTIADISDKLQDIRDAVILDTEELDKVEKELDEIASLEAERNDIIEERFFSLFEICKERERLYTQEEYPFSISENQIKLKENLSNKQKLYILLLLCSNLNYFKDVEHELTVDFETLSYYSLKGLLPSKAVVKSFGKNTLYRGNAKTKISSLAEDLNINVNSKKIESIPNTSSQERGLDLIAWLPFSDNVPNMLIILGQCACGKNWNYKQYETQRFKEYMHFDKTPIHAMFVPYAMSIPVEKKFYQHDEILSDHIFLDRKRILEQIETSDFITDLMAYPVIQKSIQERFAM